MCRSQCILPGYLALARSNIAIEVIKAQFIHGRRYIRFLSFLSCFFIGFVLSGPGFF